MVSTSLFDDPLELPLGAYSQTDAVDLAELLATQTDFVFGDDIEQYVQLTETGPGTGIVEVALDADGPAVMEGFVTVSTVSGFGAGDFVTAVIDELGHTAAIEVDDSGIPIGGAIDQMTPPPAPRYTSASWPRGETGRHSRLKICPATADPGSSPGVATILCLRVAGPPTRPAGSGFEFALAPSTNLCLHAYRPSHGATMEEEMAITIRSAEPGDGEAVARLVDALLVEIADAPSRIEARRDAAERLLGEEEAWVDGFLAFDSETAIGVLMMSESRAVYALGVFGVVTELYVVPERRSEGVAAGLLAAAAERARARGWPVLEVTTPPRHRWARTIAFYRRNGFTEIGPRLKLPL